jgi:hypothetical protein
MENTVGALTLGFRIETDGDDYDVGFGGQQLDLLVYNTIMWDDAESHG